MVAQWKVTSCRSRLGIGSDGENWRTSQTKNGLVCRVERGAISREGARMVAAHDKASRVIEANRHLIDLYAVRGSPDDPNNDPLARDVWPVLCPTYLPARPTVERLPTPLRAALAHTRSKTSHLMGSAIKPVACGQRDVLMSICTDDAEASYLPLDVRRRVTALPRLMGRLHAALTALAAPNGALESIRGFELYAGASLADELAESAFELAMIARTHLVSFYAQVRPARTTSVHLAAAAMLRHCPLNVSPTTLTSGVSGRDLRVLEAAGWLQARDEETAYGPGHRFMPTDTFLTLDIPHLPRKRPSLPAPVNIIHN